MCMNSNNRTLTRSCASRIKTSRIKIWELEHRHHCSIVGTCLDPGELRRFWRKAGFDSREPVSDYRMHIELVTTLGDNPRAARPVQKHLDRKYRAIIRNAAQIPPAGLERFWKESVACGEVAGAYWTLVTDPRASKSLLFRIYGDVHMLSHLSGASVRLDLQALDRLRRRIPKLEHELAATRTELLRRVQKKDQTIQILNKRLASLRETERILENTQRRLQKAESGEILWELRDLVTEQTDRLNKMIIRAERAEAAAEKWRLLAENAENPHHPGEHGTERSTTAPDAPALSSRSSLCGDNNCGGKNSDLCKRCVLYVGGRNRQRARFRMLVERQNGHFIHHDGGLEESTHRLAELLPRADVVLCPLDCVSHDAVQRIVRHCKQHGKALKLLPKSSLTAFAKGLNELCANE